MHDLTPRQRKILASLNAFLGSVHREGIVEDSVIVAQIALNLAVIVGQPGFDMSQIEDLTVGLVITATSESFQMPQPQSGMVN